MVKFFFMIATLSVLVSTAQAGCVTRFFGLPANQIKGFSADLIPDNDLLPISNLKVIRYPNPIADGRYIVKAELPGYVLKDMSDQCVAFGVLDPITSPKISIVYEGREMLIPDPLNAECVMALGILGSYAGRTRDDVMFRSPELIGQKEAGVNPFTGEPIMVDIFPIKKWSCED